MNNERFKDSWGFWDKDKSAWYLLSCFKCEPSGRGRENYAIAVASGTCAWCGYRPTDDEQTEGPKVT